MHRAAPPGVEANWNACPALSVSISGDRSNLSRFKVVLLALSLMVLCRVQACGPYFPNNLLDGGDRAVLVAPYADFGRELQRMKLVESRFQAVPLEKDGNNNTHASQSSEAELSDLAAALKRMGVSADEAEAIRQAHQAEREQLRTYVTALDKWEQSGDWIFDSHGMHKEKPSTPPPDFPVLKSVPGLPPEFSDYLEGAMAWYNPALLDRSFAREPWERLLARPAAERKFKSTWAAFMLGKSWEKEDSAKATEYFKQVRELTKRGFADSVGLAAASLGLEARVELSRGNLERALQLYLEQHATGDPTALNSLGVVVAAAFSDEHAASLLHLAADAKSQRVVTAYLISRHAPDGDRQGNLPGAVQRWLEAVEAAEAFDVESAEKLALAAYQAGEMNQAQRWINRTRSSPTTQWLQAKLLLRAGKVEQAAGLLAKASRDFPLEAHGTNLPARFADNLSVGRSLYFSEQTAAGRQVLGELGVLRLARREYTQALDALLRSGYWMDAAYVGERVLTVDELKTYVDRNWPPIATNDEEEESSAHHDEEINPAVLRQKVRYLLARRLMRLNRAGEAGNYFPLQWQPQFGALMQLLRSGWDETQPAEQRARSLFAAAFVVRTNGLELYGTEVGPDWRIHGGDFTEGVSAEGRTNESFQLLSASADELWRATAHHAEPEKRFHYRYQAASLAWEAARLLPDNSDETARFLCIAGSWLKNRDPQTADYFYKALVRRCRKTVIGQQADQMRWFPVLDENGNPKPYRPRLAIIEPPKPDLTEPAGQSANVEDLFRDYPLPGKSYIIHSGDDLLAIASAVKRLGFSLTVEEIIKANPGLEANQLQVGQRILIPGSRD